MGLASDLAMPRCLGPREAALAAPPGDAPGLRYKVVHGFGHLATNDRASQDAFHPSSGLILASDGNGYGTTYYGGGPGLGYGTVFRIDPAKRLSILHTFTGYPDDGAHPTTLVESDGALYGATLYGGATNRGVAFRLALDGGGWEILHHFDSNIGDEQEPVGLLLASDGQFYGTTYEGGAKKWGTVFRMDKEGKVTTLLEFDRPRGPKLPRGGLVEGPDGRLVGTSKYGGSAPRQVGTIYSLAKDGSDMRVLHSFDGDGGGYPYTAPTVAADGSLYGGAEAGGGVGFGALYRLDPDGEFTLLHGFAGFDGRGVKSPLVEIRPGVFIGTTNEGGRYSAAGAYSGGGVAFMIRADCRFQILHSFGGEVHGMRDGKQPSGPLLVGSAGQVTGTCVYGGEFEPDIGWGTIWKMVPASD
jgi:uncharacterized repeat protein (TIGR03803 family)